MSKEQSHGRTRAWTAIVAGREPGLPSSWPHVTVGVRFHSPAQLGLLSRCLLSIGAQTNVRVTLVLALQGFSKKQSSDAAVVAKRSLAGSGFSLRVLNVPNPGKLDLRSRLLNEIVRAHYEIVNADYLSFIDFDDIWFSHALSTLVDALQAGSYAVAYGDIHCADVYLDGESLYLRGLKDVYRISQKRKSDLLQGNFLPLHSYMFNTRLVTRDLLRYDESLERLEDYDVLLGLGARLPFSGLHRNRLIGLYNFYTSADGFSNTTGNVFRQNAQNSRDPRWADALRCIVARHSGVSWNSFFGEDLVL